jgi:hypothetical protein
LTTVIVEAPHGGGAVGDLRGLRDLRGLCDVAQAHERLAREESEWTAGERAGASRKGLCARTSRFVTGTWPVRRDR